MSSPSSPSVGSPASLPSLPSLNNSPLLESTAPEEYLMQPEDRPLAFGSDDFEPLRGSPLLIPLPPIGTAVRLRQLDDSITESIKSNESTTAESKPLPRGFRRRLSSVEIYDDIFSQLRTCVRASHAFLKAAGALVDAEQSGSTRNSVYDDKIAYRIIDIETDLGAAKNILKSHKRTKWISYHLPASNKSSETERQMYNPPFGDTDGLFDDAKGPFAHVRSVRSALTLRRRTPFEGVVEPVYTNLPDCVDFKDAVAESSPPLHHAASGCIDGIEHGNTSAGDKDTCVDSVSGSISHAKVSFEDIVPPQVVAHRDCSPDVRANLSDSVEREDNVAESSPLLRHAEPDCSDGTYDRKGQVDDAGADDDIVPPNISQHPFNAIEVTILACIVLVASIVLAMHEMQVQVVDGPEYPIWEATRM
ncbi:hypothetical protein C8Q76DRAFT_799706 [Earliella scabrosa]|nr:hypothetical protein C8Q76DRAFT_799706 [Earliella scabrosa]